MSAWAHLILPGLVALAAVATAPAAPFLSVDFNSRRDDPAVMTYPGFTSFLITSNVSSTAFQTNATQRTINGYRLTLTGNGLNRGYGDRWRNEPTNQGAFTESLLLRDAVFSPDTTTNGGLNLQIENLPPSRRVRITLWSYDPISAPVRSADWFVNGTLARADFRFTNSPPPVNNEQCRFSFRAVVSGSGQLMIQGRRTVASIDGFGLLHPAVYVNALVIEPEPLEILAAEIVGAELRLRFAVWPQPGSYLVEERRVDSGGWQVATGVTYGAPVDNRVTARLARPAERKFYRIRYGY